jgi:hypothetical protein
MNSRTLAAWAGGLAALAAISTPALAGTPIYSNTFESALGSGWTSNAVIDASTTANFTRFLGRYSQNEGVTLNLTLTGAQISGPQNSGTGGSSPGVRPPLSYQLMFDLFTIDSWDGLSPTNGPDRFQVLVNNTMLFNHAIAADQSMPSWTTYPEAPTVNWTHLGFNSAWRDAIFRNVTIDFTLPENTTAVAIRWQSSGLLNLNDESWGIDNVRLSYSVVPAPGTAGLLAAGGLLAARRRRAA